jgi:transaldolase / glucose-6-phosphate isomerase
VRNPVRSRLEDWSLAPEHLAAVRAALAKLASENTVARLWARDASLWTGGDEGRWLGWLDAVDEGLARLPAYEALAAEVQAEGFTHVLLLGMGGSSLGPEVLRRTFGVRPGHPNLVMLDSTDPAQVLARERDVDLARTLVLVASKSGTTLEPDLFMRYFLDRVRRVVGERAAGSRFIAITDPGSKLEHTARELGFRRIEPGNPAIGGRYSVLSVFGLVPAAVMGLDVGRLLRSAQSMVETCRPAVTGEENPGLALGAALGALAGLGRDKVTIVASPGIEDLGVWLEQLLAESTGKQGRGLIPVAGEPLGEPAVYGKDRVFVELRLETAPGPAAEEALTALARAGHPVLRLVVPDPYGLGGEFFRWEMATAVAGSILGIHPFDQPDVEASKVVTRKLTAEFEAAGALPREAPIALGDGLELHADPANFAELKAKLGEPGALGALVGTGEAGIPPAALLRAHLDRLGRGDYFALLAYLPMEDAIEAELGRIRLAVRNARGVATCLGFGPRFLHSSGQAYKGGPPSGVFLQVTATDPVDLPIPGSSLTFGVVKAAQARGDFAVLGERRRRVLSVHLPGELESGLKALRRAVERALAEPAR